MLLSLYELPSPIHWLCCGLILSTVNCERLVLVGRGNGEQAGAPGDSLGGSGGVGDTVMAGGTTPASSGGGTTAATPEDFVQRSGMTLVRRGLPFRFLGVNTYYLAGMTSDDGESYGACDFYPSTEDWRESTGAYFDAIDAVGANVVRFHASQSFAGPSGDDFTFLERLVSVARERGVLLVPTLVQQWGTCEPGGAWLTDDFFVSGYQSAGYRPGYPLSYRDYVDRITKHFANEPTILMWQMGDEFQMSYTRDDRVAVATAFVKDIAALMRHNAPNQLISIGTQGIANGGFCEWDYSGFRAIHLDPNVDLVDYHDFPNKNDVTVPISESMDLCWAVALQTWKPLFVGLSGISRDDTTYPDYVELMRNRIAATAARGYAGFLVRDFSPGNPPQGFAWGELEGDDTGALFREMRDSYIGTSYPSPLAGPAPDCSVEGEGDCMNSPCCAGLICETSESSATSRCL